MQYTMLGNSALRVSRVCLGCMGFGSREDGPHKWTVDERQTGQIVGRALELGINFFDTAAAYQGGTSELYLGSALRALDRRGEAVVATKFLPRSVEEIERGVSGQQHIARMLDESLMRLGRDHIDLYICHMWDYRTPLFEVMDGLHRAVAAGKVRYIGISNCYAYQLAEANALAEREGFPPFISVQGHYNLIFREEEREMARLCREKKIAMTPYSPLAGGRLARRPGDRTERLRKDLYAKGKYDATARQDSRIIRRVAEVADRRGVSMTEVALAWLMGRTEAPVVGVTNLRQLEGAARAVMLELSREENAYLEAPYLPHRPVGVMAENPPL